MRKLTIISISFFLIGACAEKKTATSCNRQCLLDLADTYLDAMVANDLAILTFSNDVYVVENAQHIELGDGLWKTASFAPGNFKILVPDPVSSQVGGIVMLEENDKPIELGFRLAIKNGAIYEVEHLVGRGLGENNLKNLQVPRSALTSNLPSDEQISREQLLKIAASYYDALAENDGSAAPFATDCMRRENGFQTSSKTEIDPNDDESFQVFAMMGCAEQLDTNVMSYIDALDNRRVTIADPVSGLALGFSHFRHSMAKDYVDVVGVPGIDKRDIPYDPFDLPAAHIYKIHGEQIHEIEATGFLIPYNSPTGWEDKVQ